VNVSVIVCTYNRSDMLERSLATLAAQETPEHISWEGVVVDNASGDDTPEVIRRVAENHAHIRGVREERQGLSHARNRGIRESLGELLCFVDDDALLPSDYVARAYEAWQRDEWDLAGGRAVGAFEVPPPAWARRLPPRMLNGPLGLRDLGEEGFLFGEDGDTLPIGANMLIPRRVIREIGGFDPDLGRSGSSLRSGEDSDLCWRARRAGLKIGYCGSCVVRHYSTHKRMSRSYFLRWKYAASLTGSHEDLPEGTVFWFRVPRFEWRFLLECAARVPVGLCTGRGFQRLLEFVSELGTVVGYLTRRRLLTHEPVTDEDSPGC
jgi:GT2 family glycosyltransferase